MCATPPLPLRRNLCSLPRAMGKRRLALSDSDDEDDELESRQLCIKKLKGAPQEEERSNLGEEEVRPVGRVIRVKRRGNELRRHYSSFELEGTVYELGDSVLISPLEVDKKPQVAIIKDMTEDEHGNMNVIGWRLYRPEEAERVGGGNWEVQDNRELFYSFHLDEVPAVSVMHKCVIHFIPLHKQLPVRSQHPGFIVQRVYDPAEKKLWKLKDYDDRKQHEIDLLIEKTRERIGELPVIVLEDSSARKNYYLKSKRSVARITTRPIDLLRVEPTTRFDKLSKAYGSGRSEVSKYHVLLSQFKVLTGAAQRDKWLEKLLQVTQLLCSSKDAVRVDAKHKSSAVPSTLRIEGKSRALCTGSGRDSDAGINVCWPDAVIPIITALEKVTYEALDFQKYNQKMRQFDFNIKNSPSLARRLLNRELEPVALLTMTPDELKEGLTAEERIVIEPEQTDQIQMTDSRCTRCMEKQVRVCDFICAGGDRDRYQLECNACGNTWFAARDDFTSLTSEAPVVVGNVGSAPWATAKFEGVEQSRCKSQSDAFKKSADVYFPVLGTQKSFSKARAAADPSSAPHKSDTSSAKKW